MVALVVRRDYKTIVLIFVSNTLIRLGETRILNFDALHNCKKGRPKVASELQYWASLYYTKIDEKEVTKGGTNRWSYGKAQLDCIVYQGGGRIEYSNHIALAHANATHFRHTGTGWYNKFPIQEYYCNITYPKMEKKPFESSLMKRFKEWYRRA